MQPRNPWLLTTAVTILIAISLLLGGCRKNGTADGSMRISSPDFRNMNALSARFACDGANLSPELDWSEVPDSAVTLALVVVDPDAPRGDFVHWIIYNIPATARGLTRGVPPDADLGGGVYQGMNDFAQLGYDGPCPPPGPPHRYFFRLFALDTRLDIPSGATKEELMAAALNHVVGEAELMGTYSR